MGWDRLAAICRPLRRGPGDSDLGPSGRVVKIQGSFLIRAPRPEALLPAPDGVGRFVIRATQRAWGWRAASRSLARQLVKQSQSTRGGPGTGTSSSAVDSRPLAGHERPGIRSGTRVKKRLLQRLSQRHSPTWTIWHVGHGVFWVAAASRARVRARATFRHERTHQFSERVRHSAS